MCAASHERLTRSTTTAKHCPLGRTTKSLSGNNLPLNYLFSIFLRDYPRSGSRKLNKTSNLKKCAEQICGVSIPANPLSSNNLRVNSLYSIIWELKRISVSRKHQKINTLFPPRPKNANTPHALNAGHSSAPTRFRFPRSPHHSPVCSSLVWDGTMDHLCENRSPPL